MEKSLDRKLRDIHQDPSGSREFILADAKDADMAYGIGAPGVSPERHDGELRFKTLAEYRQQIREVIRQGVVDIVLMSASTSEILTLEERLFDDSPITPGVRANDATDVHAFRGSRIPEAPARPFRTMAIDHAQCGHLDCEPHERRRGVDLGLYSVTFNNDCELDRETLEQYNLFRAEAERKGFRHFLEVFNPNLPNAIPADQQPDFIIDAIARTLAGVSKAGRPVFLKMAYQGPQAMEALVEYDPHLIVGILGGAAGTTHDAFRLLYEARKYGARAALFGRKINQAECQLAFIEFLRYIADGEIEPEEAVRAYHGVLEKLGIPPVRSLEEDLTLQTAVMSYGGSGQTFSFPAKPASNARPAVNGRPAVPGTPDFAKMTAEERLEYHQQRIARLLGE